MRNDGCQTAADLSELKGATITSVRRLEGPNGDGSPCIALTVKYADDVEVTDEDGKTVKRATYQVWSDMEGNGSGWLVLTKFSR